MGISATVDSEITLHDYDVEVALDIKDKLEIPNPDRDVAEREQIPGWWKVPRYIKLWREEKGKLIVPRGCADELFEVYDVSFIDNRVKSEQTEFTFTKEVPVRDYQEAAIKRILALEQGMYQAPPGSGKTVTILETIRRSNQRSLIIVDKTNIAEQWRERARNFLGIEIGLVGDGIWEERDITVALQQTLWSRRDNLDTFFSSWGFVCVDECHHIAASTFFDILNRIPAYYRIGVSATPYKKMDYEDVMDITIGPVIHRTDKETLRSQGWLIKPSVKTWETNSKYAYFSTHVGSGKDCEVEGCTRDKSKKRHQNNYSEVLKSLVDDNKRNTLIAKNIAKEISEGHCVVVLSKRLKHLDNIAYLVTSILGTHEYNYQFTGKQTTEERMEIVERADKGKCVLYSTIADEALDIPRIDRVHLVWPTRNTDLIIQQIGRAERPHPDKKDAIINDYLDDCAPFKSQLRDRIYSVYIPDKLDIENKII